MYSVCTNVCIHVHMYSICTSSGVGDGTYLSGPKKYALKYVCMYVYVDEYEI
jgi:hypothetical protein